MKLFSIFLLFFSTSVFAKKFVHVSCEGGEFSKLKLEGRIKVMAIVWGNVEGKKYIKEGVPRGTLKFTYFPDSGKNNFAKASANVVLGHIDGFISKENKLEYKAILKMDPKSVVHLEKSGAKFLDLNPLWIQFKTNEAENFIYNTTDDAISEFPLVCSLKEKR